ncbi:MULTISPECIES: Omp28-related outer membrane protein [unclassified Bacteroides]|jgi:hypothetical protein|uniref:Omp28-related outer membrane protein n=1 Tax=unclassified Bacteroides TaxID=2646097 RepID=UPI000E9C6395|nr:MULTISPECIES: Omp28-related outer membrane protein [unclassified Bacteroides]RGN44580.1 hypothetical protein DXB63_13755 [Bacteroides sp. OM05-12]RHR72399.1 hypothetical protein DWW69_16745 [Bacteroides sp. AF16-49]
MKNLMYCIALAIGLLPNILMAQEKPVIQTFTFEDGASLSGLSSNGLWATAKGKNSEDETVDAHPYLLDVKKGTRKYLLTDEEIKNAVMCGAYDVSNDGTVVGNYDGYPAVYKESTGWKILSDKKVSGTAEYITSDGKYIIGISMNGYTEKPLFWIDGVLQTLTGLPTIDAGGYTAEQNRFVGISEDGNIILGCLSYSHPGWGCCYYVYNRTTKKYKMLGWEEIAKPGHVDQAALSSNGKFVTGTAHIVKAAAGSDFPTEYDTSYKYDVENDTFTLNDGLEDQDIGGFVINNNGIVFGAAPFNNPARTLQYKVGDFWYSLELVLKEKYNIDYMTNTGYDYTGTPVAISSDNKTLAALAMGNTFNYIITLPETFEEAASTVNLLADPIVYPGNGYTFSKLKVATITFDKNAQIKDDAKAYIYQGETQIDYSLSIKQTTTSTKTFAITFQTVVLEKGKQYTLRIPAGTFYLPGTNIESEEINVTYTGREDIPVYTTRISPADGSNVSEISYNSPMSLTFDVPLALTEGAVGKLYQDGNEDPLCDLTIATSSNMMAAYPALKRYLYKDINYTVKIPAGIVTDIMGNCANEEIVLHYHGIYERPAQEVDNNIFSDDFSDPATSYTRFLLWDGDKNTPTEAMQEMEFDSNNTPWNFTIRETENSSDNCAGSTSMYSPAGKSNDWMSTIQLYLPNADYYLYFNSQSYKKDKEDRLKVFVWTNDAVLNNLSDDLIAQFEAKGKCIYDEIESPGESEEVLTGEWKQNKLSLAEFSGKNVYIAFVNQNEDQSMVFVDNIQVTYEGPFVIGSSTESVVVKQDEVEIAGYIKITDDKTYTSLRAYYKNNDKEVQDEIKAENITLSKGDIYKFKFNKKLPLEVGKITNYTIGVEMEGGIQEVNLNVKNLAFATTKKVVIEEGTGAWCQNCPLGIIALEHLEKQMPDNVISIGIHNNDAYDFEQYYNYLGITAYPSGVINRIDTIYSPMFTGTNEAGEAVYEFVSPAGNETFTDIVLRELETNAEAEVTLKDAVYDKSINRIALPTSVNYAVDINSANYNVLYVILEDDLVENQKNNFYNTSHPNLGEWGKGGIYGTLYAKYSYKDVARSIVGTSFNGISGYIPTSVEANSPVEFEIQSDIPVRVTDMDNASVVCMLINANTGRVVNATRSRFVSGTVDPSVSIDESTTESQNVIIRSEGQDVTTTFNTDGKAVVTLYNINGYVINQVQTTVANGETLNVSANGYSGIIIAKVVVDNQVTVQKLVIR